jgi:hypothetical protein
LRRISGLSTRSIGSGSGGGPAANRLAGRPRWDVRGHVHRGIVHSAVLCCHVAPRGDRAGVAGSSTGGSRRPEGQRAGGQASIHLRRSCGNVIGLSVPGRLSTRSFPPYAHSILCTPSISLCRSSALAPAILRASSSKQPLRRFARCRGRRAASEWLRAELRMRARGSGGERPLPRARVGIVATASVSVAGRRKCVARKRCAGLNRLVK